MEPFEEQWMKPCPRIAEGWLSGQRDALKILCGDHSPTSFDYLMLRARYELARQGSLMTPFPHGWSFGYQAGYLSMVLLLDTLMTRADAPVWFDG